MLFANTTVPLNNLELEITITDSDDIFRDTDDKVNTTMCLFHNTIQVYTDCCTKSSIGVCNMLTIMFFACFIVYACIFIYIMNKKTWLKEQGMYINVFSFQMCVLLRKQFNGDHNITSLVRGIYYSYYGRHTNNNLNWYMALRTAPLICSIQSMTSYTLHL